MVVGLICAVIAVIILTSKPPQTRKTFGIIEKVIELESGGTRYMVRVEIDGRSVLAETDISSWKVKAFKVGDTVPVGFFYTKGGKPRALLDDERMKKSKTLPVAIFICSALILIVIAVLKITGMA